MIVFYIVVIALYAIGTAMFAFRTAVEFKQVVIVPFIEGKKADVVQIDGFDLFQTLCSVVCVLMCAVQLASVMTVTLLAIQS